MNNFIMFMNCHIISLHAYDTVCQELVGPTLEIHQWEISKLQF